MFLPRFYIVLFCFSTFVPSILLFAFSFIFLYVLFRRFFCFSAFSSPFFYLHTSSIPVPLHYFFFCSWSGKVNFFNNEQERTVSTLGLKEGSFWSIAKISCFISRSSSIHSLKLGSELRTKSISFY